MKQASRLIALSALAVFALAACKGGNPPPGAPSGPPAGGPPGAPPPGGMPPPPPPKELPPPKTQGEALYRRWCMGCHEPLPGSGMDPPAGTFTLQQRYKGSVPAALEDRTDLNPFVIKAMVRNGVNIMPPLRKTEVSDQELEEIVSYLTRTNRR